MEIFPEDIYENILDFTIGPASWWKQQFSFLVLPYIVPFRVAFFVLDNESYKDFNIIICKFLQKLSKDFIFEHKCCIEYVHIYVNTYSINVTIKMGCEFDNMLVRIMNATEHVSRSMTKKDEHIVAIRVDIIMLNNHGYNVFSYEIQF